MGKLVGDFQTGFQLSDLFFNGFFLFFQLDKLYEGILPLRMRGTFEMRAILLPETRRTQGGKSLDRSNYV